MLVCTYELLKARPDICRGWQKRFRYILIDEFQDINAIQYETVKLLAQPGNNLFIVGDDDQSIYRFRGAKPEIMLNFQKDFPKAVMIQLAENYRSTECIIKGAGRVIAHNTNRFQKSTHASAETERRSQSLSFRIRQWRLWQLSKKCRICCETEESHRRSQFCSGRIPEHVFILEKFMEYNLPFRMRDGLPNIYEHWIANDLFTYIRIANGNRSRKDFLQIINRPNRYISRDYLDSQTVTLEGLRQKCRGAGLDGRSDRPPGI